MSVVYGKCNGCGARGGVNKEPGHRSGCEVRLREIKKMDAFDVIVKIVYGPVPPGFADATYYRFVLLEEKLRPFRPLSLDIEELGQSG